jgi:hypothetical protein
MSIITDKFYNFFWKNKACQNLFLLSKEELLDTLEIPLGEKVTCLSLPRIILSNVEKKDDFNYETLKFRTENDNIVSENLLSSKIELYTPLLTNFLESKFGKSLEKLVHDLEENPLKLIRKGMSLIFKDEEEFEPVIVEFLQEYGFIGKHLQSFKDIEEYFNKEFIDKNIKSLLTENNLWNLLEFLKSIKDIYVNESYKSLYTSNQILVNAVHDTEDYISRIQLFNLLYESGIISSSSEDAFIECLNCEPGTYKGVFQLKINPKRLEDLKCPVCQRELTYYIPFELHKDIYEVIKLSDGLLHDALCNWLSLHSIKFSLNLRILDDIEVDCAFNYKGINYIVECKMYKINTTSNKLIQKVRKHFGKLVADAKRIDKELGNRKTPILLVNITDSFLVNQIEDELKLDSTDELIMSTKIMNMYGFSEVFK